LEIEWNNKDPFFDRDLENFKRLHSEGGISLEIIITRGASLQDRMLEFVRRWADENKIESFERLNELGYLQTARQRREVLKRVERRRNPLTFREAWTSHLSRTSLARQPPTAKA
jgi:hypothetical protein